ncbi:chemotaxis protein CheB [Dyadobacter sediminis]|uniref:protein-glutamate methylesterase n=1 Tax=Dyadobacter sediminis TaxID=1493691 RepID=A0A5R9KMG4_9BACT|nr:chemotaxis protein CheB [Dyadobacter sediminis]TLU97422.1 chemotaxis protein CheB [Dyadobacter sediminis]
MKLYLLISMGNPKKLFIVAIGFSAGGRQDLYDFFSYLPKLPNAAFIILQHLSRDHQSLADVLLEPNTNLPVSWAADQDLVEANHIYLLAPNKLMTIHNGYLQTRDRNPQDKSNWAIDVFFNSLADNSAAMAVGVILSGTGSDGANGAVRIHEHGGVVLVQDPGTALFDGMPVSAILKDSPDEILPPRKLAYALTDYLLARQTL